MGIASRKTAGDDTRKDILKKMEFSEKETDLRSLAYYTYIDVVGHGRSLSEKKDKAETFWNKKNLLQVNILVNFAPLLL